MKKTKDNSLKNEFEERFEERQRSEDPTPPPAGPATAQPHPNTPPPPPQTANTNTGKIPVIEEQVFVGKRVVEKGKVLVSKTVNEEEVTIDLPTVEEEVDIERIPINEYVENMPPAVRYEGDVTIIPVLKEVAVIEKRIMLVEEIHIRKRKTRIHDSQQVRIKKEQVSVDRVNPDNTNRV